MSVPTTLQRAPWPCTTCKAIDKYGSAPPHSSACGVAAQWKSKTCICGHYIGYHTLSGQSCSGCMILGCKCGFDFKEDSQPKTEKPCDCGGAKLGYPPGMMHSFWNHPKDPSKWCPLRKE